MRIADKTGPYLEDRAKSTFLSVGFFMLLSLE